MSEQHTDDTVNILFTKISGKGQTLQNNMRVIKNHNTKNYLFTAAYITGGIAMRNKYYVPT